MFLLITNNPKFLDWPHGKVLYKEEAYLDVFLRARNYIQKNYKLMTHPLYGNFTPNATPFRTICLTEGLNFDMDSETLMELAIEKVQRILEMDRRKILPQSVVDDYAFIDYTLITEALQPYL